MTSNFILSEDLPLIENLAEKGTPEILATRARLLLMLHRGASTAEVSRTVSLSTSTVNKWRREYRRRGMSIFPAPAVPTGQIADSAVKELKPKAQSKPKEKSKPKAQSKPKEKSLIKQIDKSLKKALSLIEKSSGKKLAKLRKTKVYKKAETRLKNESEAAQKLLKRIKKGKKARNIETQIERLETRIAALETLHRKKKKSS